MQAKYAFNIQVICDFKIFMLLLGYDGCWATTNLTLIQGYSQLSAKTKC